MRLVLLLTLATLAGAFAALFWAFVKVGGDFRERCPLCGVRLPHVEGDFGEAGW